MRKTILIFTLLLICLSACDSNLITPEPLPTETFPVARLAIATVKSQVTIITPESTDSPIPACILDTRPDKATVLKVVDGDTIQVNINGVHDKVRYLGIDTPEMTSKDPTQAKIATKLNADLVGGKTLYLYNGETDRDQYGRLLRFVFVGDDFINDDIVKAGYASSFNRPHDAACADLFNQSMQTAYKAHSGIWRAIDALYQTDVKPVCPQGCDKHPTGCDIKGNINQNDEYIFHLPGSDGYDDVQISSTKGEKWFCTIEEAISNGWRPARLP
jgi:micrococcal nuclease